MDRTFFLQSVLFPGSFLAHFGPFWPNLLKSNGLSAIPAASFVPHQASSVANRA
jgi:hypothetical protein